PLLRVENLTKTYVRKSSLFGRQSTSRQSKAPDASFEIRPYITTNRYFPELRTRIPVTLAGHYLGDGGSPLVEGAWFVLPVKQEVLCCGIEPLAYGRGNVGVALQVKFGVEVRGKIASFHLAKR